MQQKKDITIYDIADKLNLSSATISRALNDSPVINEKTKKKIKQAAQELGYRQNNFASSLRKQKSQTIGVVIHELKSNFTTSVLSGIEKITTEAGYDLIIAHSSESKSKEISNVNNLFHKRVDGLIASLSFETENLDHFKPYYEKGIPVIFFDRVEENMDSTKVIIDNYKAGYQATRHLIDQGSRRIVIVTGNLKRNVYNNRFKGYRDALSDAGLDMPEELILIKDLSEESGVEVAEQIIKMNPLPDGAFITNDFTASVCMKRLKQLGVNIPEDIAIVGFNNDSISKIVEPSLTTINYPGALMGEVAATNLLNHINGNTNLKQMSTIIINSELIIRESSSRK
ncbi:MAG TPA: LacI family DNA-binding transcriptional regulator [Saprospiraceae bacterium]|nr:LacI family DNA-binding transcriptional regulator [Saprospiraceae bacterium]